MEDLKWAMSTRDLLKLQKDVKVIQKSGICSVSMGAFWNQR